MITGVEIIEKTGEKGELIRFRYKGYIFWSNLSAFGRMTEDDLERGLNDARKLEKELMEVKERIKNKPITEADLSLFERWQSEWGYDDEEDEE
jgi:hypothetical protein